MHKHRQLFLSKFCWLLMVSLLFTPMATADDQSVVVGINVVNPARAHIDDQNALLNQLAEAHVRVIRCGIGPNQAGIEFARRAADKGIKLLLIVDAQYPKDAPKRLWQPDVFPGMWSGHPLSSADPELSKAYYQQLFDNLDANGIALAGLELGNEINWAAFNAEFPLPGEGKVLSLNDLSHDPEGKQIAKGFLQYLKVLSALKEVRDHSRLNQNAPIISAGLTTPLDGEKLYNTKKEDMVSLSATLQFLRLHGLDELVDAYGLHFYPPGGGPGTAAGAAQRADRLQRTLSACLPPGEARGKPCWITEWGFENRDFSCPPKETNQIHLIKDTRAIFAKAASDGRLKGSIYFCWNSDPWSRTPAPYSVYRCGTLTESGRLAIEPLSPR